MNLEYGKPSAQGALTIFKTAKLALWMIMLTPVTAFSLSGVQIVEKAFQATFFESFRAETVLSTRTDGGPADRMKMTLIGKGSSH